MSVAVKEQSEDGNTGYFAGQRTTPENKSSTASEIIISNYPEYLIGRLYGKDLRYHAKIGELCELSYKSSSSSNGNIKGDN
jgi:hypothetical protein